MLGWGWGSEVRLREHVEHTGVPSPGRRGNLGAEDRRAVWGCGGTRSRAQGRDLGQEGEQIHLQRPTWLLEGGEAILRGSQPRAGPGVAQGSTSRWTPLPFS